MANGVSHITDFWSTVHDSHDIFYAHHVARQQNTQRDVLRTARSFHGKSDSLPLLYASASMHKTSTWFFFLIYVCFTSIRAFFLPHSSSAAGISMYKPTKL